MKEMLKKIAILKIYEKNGIEAVYKVLNSKEEMKKEEDDDVQKKNNEEVDYDFGVISGKLEVMSILCELRPLIRNNEDRLKLADMLEDLVKEIKNYKED